MLEVVHTACITDACEFTANKVGRPIKTDLLRFSGKERTQVMDAVGLILTDPDNGGLNPEKLKRADRSLWSYRGSQRIRIVARRAEGICRLLAVGYHDEVYRRAEKGQIRDTLDREIGESLKRERTVDLADTVLDAQPIRRTGPIAHLTDRQLTDDFRVPAEWVGALRSIADEDQFLALGLEECLDENEWFHLSKLFPRAANVSTGAKPVYRLTSAAIAKQFAAGEIKDLQFNIPASSWGIVVEHDRFGCLLATPSRTALSGYADLFAPLDERARAVRAACSARTPAPTRVIPITFVSNARVRCEPAVAGPQQVLRSGGAKHRIGRSP